jgi:uncharacterized protein YndB with AHSA1/START domain
MTTPDVPLRFECSIEVPGTPEQVWQAVATANGISSWMIGTAEMDEREGGAVVFHMGPDMSSEGSVTGWDPPRRIEYEEPRWAELAEHDSTTVTPLVTEFLVEATSGGTCVVRVVSSAFGTGADWEQEFFDEMEKGWTPMFEHLRLYLTHFPDQSVTRMEAAASVPGTPEEAVSAIRSALGLEEAGQTVDLRGTRGQVERIADESLLLRLTDPVPGFLSIFAYVSGEDQVTALVAGYLFSEDAPAYVKRETPAWQTWLERLPAETPTAR